MKDHNKEQQIVAGIIEDLQGRAGFGNVWDDISDDIQKEIIEDLEAIVRLNMLIKEL